MLSDSQLAQAHDRAVDREYHKLCELSYAEERAREHRIERFQNAITNSKSDEFIELTENLSQRDDFWQSTLLRNNKLTQEIINHEIERMVDNGFYGE